MEQFNQKIVYITGGSSGIGLAAGKRLAEKGALSRLVSDLVVKKAIRKNR